MNKNVMVHAFTPIVHLGVPAENASEILRCIDTVRASGEALCVFPSFCLCGATLGSLMLHENLLTAVGKALFDICASTLGSQLHIVLGTYKVDSGAIFQNFTYIYNGKIQKVFENIDEISIFGIRLLPTYVKARAMGFEETITMLRSISHGCAVVYTASGYGESTTDTVPSGVCAIAQDGKILSSYMGVYGEDCGILKENMSVSAAVNTREHALFLPYVAPPKPLSKTPFFPHDTNDYQTFAHDIFNIQVAGLVRRMSHVGTQKLVCALSGGLDSALAVLVCKGAMLAQELPLSNILSITMPCFGTTGRTFDNALGLMNVLGATSRTIDIKKSVEQHFMDIGHLMSDHSVVFENAQARERTQVGLDLANKIGGIFVGTGDLSELALGFTTFSGDHMAMYGVNCGLPKTIVRFMTEHLSNQPMFSAERPFLRDILNTPISPELLPPADNVMSQKTESILGSYELHDFSIYYLLRGMDTAKIFENACALFGGEYKTSEIEKALKTLISRFFSQQFKRSCAPDGVAPLGISVSPRDGLVMPSDAKSTAWELRV